MARIVGGQIVLADLVHGSAGAQARAQPVALDAGFVGAAFLRIEVGAIAIAGRLRVVDGGVTGVQRVLGVQGIDQPGIGGEDAVFLRGRVGVPATGGGGEVVAAVVHQLAAKNQLEIIAEAKAASAVQAGLAAPAVIDHAGVCVHGLSAVIPLVDVDGFAAQTRDVQAAVGVTLKVGVVHAKHQFVLAPGQGEWATYLKVDAFVVQPVVAPLGIELQAVAGDRVERRRVDG